MYLRALDQNSDIDVEICITIDYKYYRLLTGLVLSIRKMEVTATISIRQNTDTWLCVYNVL